MAKSRGFSIYLLKSTFSNENALKEDHSLELLSEGVINLPDGAFMYIADRPSSVPWWKNYWGVQKDLYQMQKGALVFLPINNRWVVLTFGMTYHQLNDNCYEYDFGLRTTLNALDPTKIKSTDILQPENAKRQRVQSPTASELNFFDLRSDETILKKMTGAVKDEYADLFKNITGGNSLKVSSNLQADGISDLCINLVEIYEKDDYKTTFPELQNIVPVKDPALLDLLKKNLIEAFNRNPAPVELVLSIPELFDYSTDYKIKFSGEGRSNLEFTDVYIKGYREYLLDKGIEEVEDVEKFNTHKLRILDDNEILIKEYSIYKSFLFDCEVEGKTYHLCEGEWYFIETDFIINLSTELDSIFIDNHSFLLQCEDKREDDYNISVKNSNPNIICLDKKSISPNGQYQVEPCDLIYINNNYLELAHVKISTRSSSLSHLFNQGVNSVQLLRSNNQAKDKLKELVENEVTILPFIDEGKYSVTYGIITKNDKAKKSKSLPIFSRISLLRTVNALRTMNIPVSAYYIFDNVDRKNLNQEED
ncbi:TIGR04141 family sporadically distributed protein [Flavobacterium sp. LS1R49]|uniref:TIGR04141 family sporadically distributed protein n=1 Tax=Flavobacterium shii TaxID=2987687 RepID=A0A9X2ZFC9_9FLAO|nr:DUF6119 family protein [Flavobacterium shii]MCV9926633.1 TIGR04141 family sporadically distributed protein [Flavobacterium shii]